MGKSSMERDGREGETPVANVEPHFFSLGESDCLGMQSQEGGTRHLRLNKGKRPIANKYREGKMKRTLKRESKVREIAARETNEWDDSELMLGLEESV
jgi:hypothetical protein